MHKGQAKRLKKTWVSLGAKNHHGDCLAQYAGAATFLHSAQ